MMPLTHSLIVLTAIVILSSLIVEIVRDSNSNAKKVFLPVLILSLSSVLEVVGYYFQHISILKYVAVGFVLFVISIGLIDIFSPHQISYFLRTRMSKRTLSFFVFPC